MAGWILLSLWASINSIADEAATLKHVRSLEPRLREAIVDGYVHSATFRELVDSVEELSCVVYIGTIVKLSEGMRGALLHRKAGNREMPVLRVLLKAGLSHEETMAVIGHELQHVIEAVRDAAAAVKLDWAAAFDRLEPTQRAAGIHRYETDLAIGVATKIVAELKSARRQ